MSSWKRWLVPGVILLTTLLGIEPARAQNGEGGRALGDVIVWAIQEALKVLFGPIEAGIQRYGPELINTVVATPHPESVFTQPSNGPWPNIYGYYWEAIIPLTLFLYALSIGMVIFLESTSHLFTNYHRSKLKKRAFSGLLGILGWWWIAALSMRFTDALTGFLVPDLSQISLFQTLSFSAIGVIGLVISLSVDFALFVLIAVIYLARHLALYLYIILMPILIVFWIPGVGPFSIVSQFMKPLRGSTFHFCSCRYPWQYSSDLEIYLVEVSN